MTFSEYEGIRTVSMQCSSSSFRHRRRRPNRYSIRTEAAGSVPRKLAYYANSMPRPN
jgi:hypothetical protein